jgi:DNA polymerase-4
MSRTILHVDLDAFYCAVEEQQQPSLRGRAFAVGGRPETRGVVASCSYPARERGVRSAMPMSTALRLCPGLIVVPSRHSLYRSVSHRVMALLQSWTPHLEQLSIDEAFLDVTELVVAEQTKENQGGHALTTTAPKARALALRIQQQIRDELGLSCSMGLASNKMVAKIATDYGKVAGSKAASDTGTSPAAICVVPPGEEAIFLAPLSVAALWGVGPRMAERLAALGITTIGELAQRSERELVRSLGRQGYELAQHARGIDKREIVTERPSKSISSETTFPQDIEDWELLEAALAEQAHDVVRHLQKQQLRCTTVKIKVRWPDFSITSRQTTMPEPTAERGAIEDAARRLLLQLWQGNKPVRLLGVGVSGLNAMRQLSLWDDNGEAPDANGADVQEHPVAGLMKSEDASQREPGSSDPDETSEAEAQRESTSSKAKRQQIHESIARLEARYGAAIVRVAAQLEQKSAG